MNEEWLNIIVALIVTIFSGIVLLFIEYRTRWFARFIAKTSKNKSQSSQTNQYRKVVAKIGGNVASDSRVYVAGGDIGTYELPQSSDYEKLSTNIQLAVDGDIGQDSDIKVAGKNINIGAL